MARDWPPTGRGTAFKPGDVPLMVDVGFESAADMVGGPDAEN
jgi:hypothetical protein